MAEMNRQVLLVSRPQGAATLDNFKLVETPLAPLADGQFRVRNHYLSLDPYMRGRMNDSKSYAAPQPLNEVMIGGTVGEVVESKHPSFAAGDKVVGMLGWQEYGTSDGKGIAKVDATQVPLSAYLGSVGMPGVTGWYGLKRIIAPQAGNTIVVSAASGAVGSVVGQLAKFAGCRVVGIAGGADKCRYVVDSLGFDACVDYKAGNLHQDLKEATLCGMIARYDGAAVPLKHPELILTQRLMIQGFIVSEHMDVWPQALQELGGLVAQKKLHFRESVAVGLDAAPQAFLGMLKGHNFGKQIVKLI